jgi:hypothetical protein
LYVVGELRGGLEFEGCGLTGFLNSFSRPFLAARLGAQIGINESCEDVSRYLNSFYGKFSGTPFHRPDIKSVTHRNWAPSRNNAAPRFEM